MPNEVKLLPCPFCDHDDELQISHIGAADEWWWEVFCDHCCTHGPTAATEHEVIAAWNTRPTTVVAGERQSVGASANADQALAVPVERFWQKVDKAGDCWIWTAATNPSGYGRFAVNRKLYQAHRISLLLAGQEVAPDAVVDHICRNRLCVRPSHLRVVDRRTNIFENSQAPAALNALKTHCPKGHPYSGDNLIVHASGKRRCRICVNAEAVARRAAAHA